MYLQLRIIQLQLSATGIKILGKSVSQRQKKTAELGRKLGAVFDQG
jgi:hypothetical protein